jgi:hypothetical protein
MTKILPNLMEVEPRSLIQNIKNNKPRHIIVILFNTSKKKIVKVPREKEACCI